jgi:hypothetical protein
MSCASFAIHYQVFLTAFEGEKLLDIFGRPKKGATTVGLMTHSITAFRLTINNTTLHMLNVVMLRVICAE